MTVQEAKILINMILEEATSDEHAVSYVTDCQAEELKIAIECMEEVEQYRALGTVEELKENKDFLEFLYNAIQPNEMEQYLSMYNAKDTKTVATEGYTDQCGLMSAT